MSKLLNPHHTGLALGGTVGGFHVIWSILVALGLGQAFIDFIFKLHMLEPIVTVQPFVLPTAAGLVIVTSLIGYGAGYAFGWLWNSVQKS